MANGGLKRNRKLAQAHSQPRKRWNELCEREGRPNRWLYLRRTKIAAWWLTHTLTHTHQRSGNFKRAWPTFPGNGLGTSTAVGPVPPAPSQLTWLRLATDHFPVPPTTATKLNEAHSQVHGEKQSNPIGKRTFIVSLQYFTNYILKTFLDNGAF